MVETFYLKPADPCSSLLLPLQEVFKPTLQYLKAEQFDSARTNTNYITKYFNIKKKIDALIVQASDVVEDPDTVSEAPRLITS